ncbi:MAG: hypothetical protein KGI71_01490 [Patescibacteria group bacterium]|nr:hypothetical protein [Patescibacteria group bacterium]
MGLVVPAILPTSHDDLREKLALFARLPSVDRVQIDVVDGRFASPASWPYTAAAEFRKMVERGEMLPETQHLEYEMDLMCFDAEEVAGDWLALGASHLILHAESVTDPARLLASLRKRYGGGADIELPALVSLGLALNIASDIALIEPCLGAVDYVQFMGIADIGKQGQPFDRRALEKVRVFRSRHPEVVVQVDGGISLETAKEFLALGVSSLVVGSAILHAPDPAAALAAFEALQSPFGV